MHVCIYARKLQSQPYLLLLVLLLLTSATSETHACVIYLGPWYALSTGLTAAHSRSVSPSVRLSPAQKIKHRLILVRPTDKPPDKPKIPPCTVSFCRPEGKPSVFTELIRLVTLCSKNYATYALKIIALKL